MFWFMTVLCSVLYLKLGKHDQFSRVGLHAGCEQTIHGVNTVLKLDKIRLQEPLTQDAAASRLPEHMSTPVCTCGSAFQDRAGWVKETSVISSAHA